MIFGHQSTGFGTQMPPLPTAKKARFQLPPDRQAEKAKARK